MPRYGAAAAGMLIANELAPTASQYGGIRTIGGAINNVHPSNGAETYCSETPSSVGANERALLTVTEKPNVS